MTITLAGVCFFIVWAVVMTCLVFLLNTAKEFNRRIGMLERGMYLCNAQIFQLARETSTVRAVWAKEQNERREVQNGVSR